MRPLRVLILQRYVLKEHLLPFLLGFSVVTFLLSMDFLFDYLDLLIGKGIPALIVLQLFMYGLGWMVALSIPCGVLVAVLMTFGRLSQDNEITAMKSNGVNALLVMLPPLFASLVLAALLALFMNFVLPDTNHAFANLLVDISRKRPTAEIRAGVFIGDFEGYSILINKLDDRTGKMSNVTIYDFHTGSVPTTIFARKGRLAFSDDKNTLSLHLQDGEIHEVPDIKEPRKYRRLVFKTHVINVPNVSGQLERSDRHVRGEREMTVRDLKERMRQLAIQRNIVHRSLLPQLQLLGYGSYEDFLARTGAKPGFEGLVRKLATFFAFWRQPKTTTALDPRSGQSLAVPPGPGGTSYYLPRNVQYTLLELDAIERQLNSLRVEIHKKFSIPFACVIFVLVGVPLGMKARKSGLAIGFASVGFFIFYYIFLLGGEQLADRRLFPPGIAVWLPNIVLGGAGLLLTLDACDAIRLSSVTRRLKRRRAR
ncbi:MAG: LptF/LptG family permease [Candidatus Eisenbacteria bacterium]